MSPIEKAQDILRFSGETVHSKYLLEIIRELLVHIAMPKHKLEDDWLPCSCGHAREDCPSYERCREKQ
jgi:hypothetical protein